ncbi:MAG: SCO1664 family protein [Nitriliruptorales bacterium]
MGEPPPGGPDVRTESGILDLLASAPLEPLGRFTAASNATLLCRLGDTETLAVYKPRRGDTETLAVYKPRRGEAPLWDFPDGTLHRREVAAYVLDRALGWDMVPPTVLRDDAPFGTGSIQLHVEHDPGRHYFALLEDSAPAVLDQLRRMVVLDLVLNNADRKGGHVLFDGDGRVRLVDHGVCFHAEPKLRTVAWDFAGEPIADDVRSAVADLAARLARPDDPDRAALADLLVEEEVTATAARAEAVAQLDRLPPPTGPRPYPWPPI